MRITDVFLAFPALLLSLALAVVLTPSVRHATSPSRSPGGRGTRGWSAARRPPSPPARTWSAAAAGRPPVDLLRHVLPNSITPVLVQISLDAGGIILTAAALSFLGLGAQDPTAEWGLMVSQGQTFFTTNWWVVTFPGLAILVTAFAFNLLGDGLRDALDPRGCQPVIAVRDLEVRFGERRVVAVEELELDRAEIARASSGRAARASR